MLCVMAGLDQMDYCAAFLWPALIVVFGVVMVGSTGIVVRAISLLSSTGP